MSEEDKAFTLLMELIRLARNEKDYKEELKELQKYTHIPSVENMLKQLTKGLKK